MSFFLCGRESVFILTFLQERAGEAAWMITFINARGCFFSPLSKGVGDTHGDTHGVTRLGKGLDCALTTSPYA